MKRITKTLSLLLALVLLAGCLGAAGAEEPEIRQPDFAALVAAGEQARVPGVIIRTDPIYYANYIQSFTGNYAAYRDATTGYCGVIDHTGRILWQSDDPAIGMIETYANGLCAVMTEEKGWQPYTVYGKRLCPENVSCGEINSQCDWATGQELYVIGEVRDAGNPEPVGGILVDAAGHVILEEALGSVYDGRVPYRKDGKWGLRAITGEVLLAPQYDELSFLNGDTLLACRDGVYNLIGVDGAVKTALTGCTEAESLAPNAPLLLVKENGLWGVRDETGALRFEARWDSLYPAYYGRERPFTVWFYGTDDGVTHFLSLDGVDITLPSGSATNLVWVISGDRFVVGNHEEGYLAVDGEGNPLLEERFDRCSFTDGDSCVILTNISGSGNNLTYSGVVCDTALRPLVRVEEVRYLSTTADSVVYEKDGNLFYVSLTDGTLLAELEDTGYASTKGSFVLAKRNGSFAMTDTAGRLLTDFIYDGINSFHRAEGLACLTGGGFFYLLDCRGRELTPPLDEPVRLNVELSPYAAWRSDNCYGFLQYRGADELLFADLSAGDWFCEGVEFCAQAGLMNGVGGGRFAPQTVMTRAMLVQVLYNLSGEKCAAYGFEDVAADAWYYDAVNWAAANGIVTGKSATRFAPNDPVTREQMVTILRRYALHFGAADGEADALEGFADAGSVSGYATDAMRWAVSAGLINGVSADAVNPGGQASRAQIATILMRFVRLMTRPEAEG